MSSNINSEYEAQIASIVDSVMETVDEIHDNDPNREIDDLNDIITGAIDERSIYYADQAYYLARYHMENGFPTDKDGNRIDELRWSDVWDMVFNDVYTEVDEKIKEKYSK